MKTSEAGIALVKAHEGLRIEAYPDAGYGWNRATIGYGHTSAAGPPAVSKGMKITAAGATEILRSDLAKFEGYVSSAVKVPLTQPQFDALVSFVFNVGPGNLRSSTLLRKLNARDYAGAADQFLVWNKSNGKTLAGLTKRRQAERALFLTTYAAPPPRPATTPKPPVLPPPADPRPVKTSDNGVISALGWGAIAVGAVLLATAIFGG